MAPSYDHLRVFGCMCFPNINYDHLSKLSLDQLHISSLDTCLFIEGIDEDLPSRSSRCRRRAEHHSRFPASWKNRTKTSIASESATSPAIPPQHSEHHPPNQINSTPISSSTPQAPMNVVAFDEIDEEPSCFKYLDSKEYADKYKRYESEFKQWILAKHFYPNAVSLYEGKTIIGGETILSSKWPCTRFYADPCISFAEEEDEDEDEEEAVKRICCLYYMSGMWFDRLLLVVFITSKHE